MRASADQQRAFLFGVRPSVSAAAAAGLSLTALLAPEGRPWLFLGLALCVLGVAAVSAFAGWRLPAAWVIRAGLLIDTGLLAAAGVDLQEPYRLALGYLWPIGIAAVVLGGLDAAVFIACALVAVAITPVAVGYAVEPQLLGGTEAGLMLLGAALAAATRRGRQAEALLAEQAAQEAQALAISERMRSSLRRDAVLRATVAELGRSGDLAACTLLVHGSGDRDGQPESFSWPPAVSGRIGKAAGGLALAALQTDEPVELEDGGHEAGSQGELRSLLTSCGLHSGFAAPLGWGGETVAAVGFVAGDRRNWRREVLPLLERLGPQLAAALAQADAYEQQQQTIAALEEFDEQRQQIVAAVSHELRTPVAATLGFLETVLARPQLSADERRRFLHEAADGARRLARLVDDLLVLTRTERRALPLVRERVEPARLLERALSGLIVPDGREISFHAEGNCAVAGDADRLLQVLTNLVSNAILHGRGKISVRCRSDQDRVVVIEVADEGPAIPPALRDHLFVPFARFGANESTGLGLAIARSLTEAHGGSLSYRVHPGPPAFVLKLPASDAHETAGMATAVAG